MIRFAQFRDQKYQSTTYDTAKSLLCFWGGREKGKPQKMQKDAAPYTNSFGEMLFQHHYLTQGKHFFKAEDA